MIQQNCAVSIGLLSQHYFQAITLQFFYSFSTRLKKEISRMVEIPPSPKRNKESECQHLLKGKQLE